MKYGVNDVVTYALAQDSSFFQAEDGIRYVAVTGVQTCALPIFLPKRRPAGGRPGHVPEEDVALTDETAGDEGRLDGGRPRSTITGIPRSAAAVISRAPGSLTPGRPASLTSATRFPSSRSGRISAVRRAPRCRPELTRRGEGPGRP